MFVCLLVLFYQHNFCIPCI